MIRDFRQEFLQGLRRALSLRRDVVSVLLGCLMLGIGELVWKEGRVLGGYERLVTLNLFSPGRVGYLPGNKYECNN